MSHDPFTAWLHARHGLPIRHQKRRPPLRARFTPATTATQLLTTGALVALAVVIAAIILTTTLTTGAPA